MSIGERFDRDTVPQLADTADGPVTAHLYDLDGTPNVGRKGVGQVKVMTPTGTLHINVVNGCELELVLEGQQEIRLRGINFSLIGVPLGRDGKRRPWRV